MKLGQGLFQGIGNGSLTKEACLALLNGYRNDRAIMLRNRSKFGAELFASKLSDINLSIEFMKIIIERYDQIAKEFSGQTDKSIVR